MTTKIHIIGEQSAYETICSNFRGLSNFFINISPIISIYNQERLRMTEISITALPQGTFETDRTISEYVLDVPIQLANFCMEQGKQDFCYIIKENRAYKLGRFF